ncbi:hypothetical protein [Massilia endophytica]|uniref:hypothetical protein n=1 Tax=Massilia endophytica TaxID=2899220 RepID=UPI001E318C1D|nr:hypothetical protein [Massilia endophytica]UGQ45074.1 hypothetical protein LSQ66_14870 [Massilia endophytica]
MKLASYKATRPGLHGIANVLIRIRLGGQYSHSEIVFMPGDGVDALMPDGTCEPVNGAYWCASSVAAERLPAWSKRRPGRAGGVRFKRIQLDPDKWDLLDLQRDARQAARWFVENEGMPYDWQLILGFIAWFIHEDEGRVTCSEACASAGGHPDSWRFDPCALAAAHTCVIPTAG